jgi:hypothetical protein
MRKLVPVLGIVFVVLALVVLVFAEGGRRWYSGLFFALIGTLMLIDAARRRRAAGE